MPEIDKIEQIREQIMLASMAHVSFDGWNRTALRAGALDAGYDDGHGLTGLSRRYGSRNGAVGCVE